MPISAEDRRRHARVAATARWRPERPSLADDRRILKFNALERHVRRVLASPIPPTQAECVRLALLLLGGGDAA